MFRIDQMKCPKDSFQRARLLSLWLCLAGLSLQAALPFGWTDGDIGSPAAPGSAACSNGLWTISGGGGDICSHDQLHLVWKPITGDGQFVARVESVKGTTTAQAGLMVRNGVEAGGLEAAVLATANNVVLFQWRGVPGGACSYQLAVERPSPGAAVWLKLARTGNTFSAYWSTNNIVWSQVGSARTVDLNQTVLAGLAVSAINSSTSVLGTATFSGVSLPLPVFGIYRELWTGLNPALGSTLSALTNTLDNPGWPDHPNTNFTAVYSSFETEADTGLNDYGQRLRALLVPPVSGAYTFWIASDNTSELWLSTDETPENAVPIAGVGTLCGFREWTRDASQQSAPALLRGGCRYYLEARMQQGDGADNLSVRWMLPNGTIEEPLAAWSGQGTRLLPYTGVDNPPGIYLQPANQTVADGAMAVLALLVTNQSAVAYQWRLNGAKLGGPNATSPVYVIDAANPWLDTNQLYSCVVSNAAGVVTSAVARLTVLADTAPPTVARTVYVGPASLQIVFSEPVEAASATNPANYVITNGVEVIGATLGPDNLTVTLATEPLVLGNNYVLVLNGIRDRATLPNGIATNSRILFVAAPFSIQPIGNPSPAGAIVGAGAGYDISGGGKDIGGTNDQFQFAYQTCSADFDVKARLAYLTPTDLFAKAGLMVREDLTASSRFAAVLATPNLSGSFFEYRPAANGQAVSAGNLRVNYPQTWLRLRRVGNQFTGYAGYDGLVWQQLGSVTLMLTNPVYLGMVVCSHDSSQAAIGQFRDFMNVTNAVEATVIDPREPLSPSSRKTPIAISEIMFKPAPRADTNNLEFIELYNSNPWFHDLSGYRLTANNLAYTFPAGAVLAGGAFVVVAASPDAVQSVYGITNVIGPYTGSLKKADTLQLFDEQGALLLTVPYSNVPPWPVATDGAGHSLVLSRPSYGEEDPRAWDLSDVFGGSPGQLDACRPTPLRNVVINEFLARTDLPDYDYIELYNHANTPVDISGCILTDDPATNRFVVPAGTVIPARGFAFFSETNLNFALSGAGETIYFKNPNQSRVLDAVTFGGQEHGVATGRWPDGANQFYRLTARTPGVANAPILQSQVVINELMYDPISGDDNDQYVELFNRGTNVVNLAGWGLSDAVSYTFPPGTVLEPDGYLVVAFNAAHLRSTHADLNPANCLGDFAGRLSHQGEHLALTMPDTIISTNRQDIVSTNLIHITVNDLSYGCGGRWGQWAAGGGSSLELLDPNNNNRLAANWGDSDETQKSVWTNIETTGVLDNGANYSGSAISYAQIGLLEVGECLVDNVEVRPGGSTGANMVANSGFEGGLGNWSLQGDHCRSSLDNSGYSSLHSLHIRCSDSLWTGVNACQAALSANTLAAGRTATLRFKARWLRGWPEVLLRLHGNWLEAAGRLPVPANLGTPGARNSRCVANAGPAIYEVTHTPALPAAGQAAVVTARVHDFNAVQSLALNYRIDPGTTCTSVPMNDGGAGGDAIAGDGVFSATIPGQGANVIAAFYLSTADSKGATNRFPVLLNDNTPARECLVMFGDSNPGGSFTVYHAWITQANANRWASLGDLSNETHDFTFVTGPRVIYNAQGRFSGSPYHQNFNSPYGNLCNYKWIFPEDDKLYGATSFNKIHQPGNDGGDDSSIQREQLANTFLRTLGVPWLNRRYVAVYFNGRRRGPLMEDAQTPDADMVQEYFPNDKNGWLYKMAPWFEFDPAASGMQAPFANQSWCNLAPYTTTGGAKKVARYRYNFLVRRAPFSASDFTNVFSLVDAAASYGSPGYMARMESLADMENWMRVFAANHAAGNWDCFGGQTGQNLYAYLGALGTRFSLLMFDFNIVLGHPASLGPGQNLFSSNGQDPNTPNIFNEPAFRRMYWRALQELVNGPLDAAKSGPLLDAKYNVFEANGLSVENPNSAIKSWLTSARASISSQLAAENTGSFTVDQAVTVSGNVAHITGKAPVAIKTLWINGVEYPVTWTSVTRFRIAVPLMPGTNQLSVLGVDMHGQPVPGASNRVATIYSGAPPSPVGQVVINEIMCRPAVAGAEFVELYNSSTNLAFDLSGWQVQGLNYSFPSGSLIQPNACLVLAANAAAFAAAYGVASPPFDVFSGKLQADGETLTLLRPGTNAANDLVVAKVRYDTSAPWPANAPGISLQLIDAQADTWRIGNWAAQQTNFHAPSTPGTQNSAVTRLPSFPPLWINELQADNLSGITNRAGNRTAWFELYNPTTNLVSLSGLFLANTCANLTQWAFPVDSVIAPRQFKLIFADGQAALSTSNELHTSFALPSRAGSLALSRLFNGQPQVVDYVAYTNLTPNCSFGSLPDGQAFDRRQFFTSTPGGTNDGTLPASFISYAAAGAVYTQDFNSLPNPGAASINADNPVTMGGTTYSLPNPFDFALPPAASGQVGGLGLPALSGWHGLAELGTRFGAASGDQTTGGQISFGAPNSTNRALGLLATSSTGATAFGARLLNQTTNTFNRLSLWFTGKLWRQSDRPKTLVFSYFVDSSGATPFPTNHTAFLPSLAVGFPTSSGAVGGAAVDGNSPANRISLGVTNQITTNWPPGAALWLVWTMADSAGKSQGLAIDDFHFSATTSAAVNTAPVVVPPGDKLVYLGQTLSFIAQAADSDAGQSLVFSLDPGAPANAAIAPDTGRFTWTPAPTQVPGIYPITVRATDDGDPPLSGSQTFSVTAVSTPKLETVGLGQTHFTLSWPTQPGAVYRVQFKNNLTDPAWNSFADDLLGDGGPLSITFDTSGQQQRFYRLLLVR